MAEVKLYYFNARGIAEPIRWILSYGGIIFEDIRAPFTGFPATLPDDIKAKSRWGQVPLVEFEGKSLTQSVAVTRYFAKKAKLVPEDMYQAALCDEYIDAARDFMSPFYGVIRETDESKRPEKLQEVLQTVKPKYFDVFEKIVKSNDGKHLVGTSLTWADVVLAYLFNHFHTLLGVDLTEGYPSLKKLVDNVTSTPAIKAWIDKRPKTQF